MGLSLSRIEDATQVGTLGLAAPRRSMRITQGVANRPRLDEQEGASFNDGYPSLALKVAQEPPALEAQPGCQGDDAAEHVPPQTRLLPK